MGDRSLQDLARVGGALVLAAALGFLVVMTSSGADDDPGTAVVLGPVGGEVVTTVQPAATPISSAGFVTPTEAAAEPAPEAATPAPAATPVPTPAPTPAPAAADGFSARVLACRSVSGPNCQGQLSEMAASGSFSALVLLEDSRPGDVIEALLVGGGRTARGGPASVGGGDGYYFTTFGVNGLPPGTYTVVATRNGDEVDSTTIVLN